MARSNKRYGLILDRDSWTPPEEWPLPNTPALTMSPTSSVQSLDETDSSSSAESPFSSFYFSTDDENLDEYEFHHTAALMLAAQAHPQGKDSEFASEEADQLESESAPIASPHSNLGRDYYGRSCCSCGKSFSTSFRLSEHIKQSAGSSMHPCTACGKVYKRQSNLARHVAAAHSRGHEKCPGCGLRFEAGFLPKHLASGAGRCGHVMQDVCSVDSDAMPPPWWIRGDDHCRPAMPLIARDSGIDIEAEQDTTAALDNTDLHPDPESDSHEVSCELCGEHFDSCDQDFAQHLRQHSLDFAEKRHLCHECEIYFASQTDCERHSRSVTEHQHCGFSFQHASETCTGHHAPMPEQQDDGPNDHDLMQKHLWAWEQRQLQIHRSHVAKCLAESLSRPIHSSRPPALRHSNASVFSQEAAASIRDSKVSELGFPHRIVLDLSPAVDETIPTSPRAASIRNARDSLRTKSMRNIARLYKRKTGADLDAAAKGGSADATRPTSMPESMVRTGAMPMVSVA